MRARPLLLGSLLSASSLLTVLLALSIAEMPVLTSGADAADDRSSAPVRLIGRLRAFAGVPSAQKKQNPAMAPSLQGNLLAAAGEAQPLLPVVNRKEFTANHRILADKTLRTLPSGCRDNLKNFYVRYDNPKNRGLGGKTTIIITGNVPDSEFIALLTHECAHVIHSNMTGNPSASPSAFKDGLTPIAKDSPLAAFLGITWENEHVLKEGVDPDVDFVSGYASSDPFEDFAETFAAYMLHPDALAEQAEDSAYVARKLAWMQTAFPRSEPITDSAYDWDGTAPWDITKQPYVWLGNTRVAAR